MGGLQKIRPPPIKTSRGKEVTPGTTSHSLRVRQNRRESPRVREIPGWDTLDSKQQHPAVESLKKRKECGYNLLKVVQSTIEGAGYGLFLGQPKIKAEGLLTTYEGIKLTEEQVDAFHSHYIFEATDKEGQPVYEDVEKENCGYLRAIY